MAQYIHAFYLILHSNIAVAYFAFIAENVIYECVYVCVCVCVYQQRQKLWLHNTVK